MRKVNLVLLFFMAAIVAVSSYFIFFDSPQYNFQKYQTRKNELLQASSYSNHSAYFNLLVTSTPLDNGQYNVVATIHEVSGRMEQVEALLVSGNEKTQESDALYPSINILYPEVLHLIPQASVTTDIEKHGLNLNFVSDTQVTLVYLFIGFRWSNILITLYIEKAVTF